MGAWASSHRGLFALEDLPIRRKFSYSGAEPIMRLSPFLATLSAAAALSFTAASTAGLVNVQEPQREVSFGRDIRPILSDRCFQCHGPDSETREENLRLDIPENALAPREGYSILTPGDPDNSELW